MQALTLLSNAGRVDMRRVLVLRTVSNLRPQAPGSTAAASLKDMASGNYSAYMRARSGENGGRQSGARYGGALVRARSDDSALIDRVASLFRGAALLHSGFVPYVRWH